MLDNITKSFFHKKIFALYELNTLKMTALDNRIFESRNFLRSYINNYWEDIQKILPEELWKFILNNLEDEKYAKIIHFMHDNNYDKSRPDIFQFFKDYRICFLLEEKFKKFNLKIITYRDAILDGHTLKKLTTEKDFIRKIHFFTKDNFTQEYNYYWKILKGLGKKYEGIQKIIDNAQYVDREIPDFKNQIDQINENFNINRLIVGKLSQSVVECSRKVSELYVKLDNVDIHFLNLIKTPEHVGQLFNCNIPIRQAKNFAAGKRLMSLIDNSSLKEKYPQLYNLFKMRYENYCYKVKLEDLSYDHRKMAQELAPMKERVLNDDDKIIIKYFTSKPYKNLFNEIELYLQNLNKNLHIY